jgi:hypothetical protein
MKPVVNSIIKKTNLSNCASNELLLDFQLVFVTSMGAISRSSR